MLIRFAVFLFALNTGGCKKFVEVKPPSTRITESNVYNTDETAIAVLTQIYTVMAAGGDGGFAGKTGMSVFSGLSADELTLANSVVDNRLMAYYTNQLRTSQNVTYGSDCWEKSWSTIFTCNAAIEGLTQSTSLTAAVKKQLLGEAKFIRGLSYFYLVNYYGDVPLVVTTDPNENRLLPRSSVQQLYEQILTDLKDAQSLLSNSFLDASLLKSTSERVRPTQWAATALLARTYLYMAQYANAEAEATKVIANGAQFSLCTSTSAVFLKSSTEAIWQLQPVVRNRNTEDAMTFILPATGPNKDNNPVYLNTEILAAFEVGDARRRTGGWVDSVISGGVTYYFPAKYKATVTTATPTEYQMMFRLAEQYLIRAEARAQQNNIQGAKEDLNIIRARAMLQATTANDQASLLTAVLKERQVELFTELGQRWLDLKRTGKVDEVMNIETPRKANGSAWESYQQLYPIMFNDLQSNPNLTQNAGY